MFELYKSLKTKLRCGRDAILQHDNAHLHMSCQTQDAFKQMGFQPLYTVHTEQILGYWTIPCSHNSKSICGNPYDSDGKVVVAVCQW